jgi:Transposase zinc-ribbon domain
MSRSTISTFQLFALFPTEDSARVYLEKRLWPNGAVCPDCKSGDASQGFIGVENASLISRSARTPFLSAPKCRSTSGCTPCTSW